MSSLFGNMWTEYRTATRWRSDEKLTQCVRAVHYDYTIVANILFCSVSEFDMRSSNADNAVGLVGWLPGRLIQIIQTETNVTFEMLFNSRSMLSTVWVVTTTTPYCAICLCRLIERIALLYGKQFYNEFGVERHLNFSNIMYVIVSEIEKFEYCECLSHPTDVERLIIHPTH